MLQVVWFKRDLRTADHACLFKAAKLGPVLPLYVVEPDYWKLPDTSARQFEFISGSLRDLSCQLDRLGGNLSIRIGAVLTILESLRVEHGSFNLWAHEETGNYWTFERDKDVRKWCKNNEIEISELPAFGVFRGSRLDRDTWARDWETLMSLPVYGTPKNANWVNAPGENLPSTEELGMGCEGLTEMQLPGLKSAEGVLNSFLFERGEHYRTDMSSPLKAERGCSRLSPYIAYGTLSVRQIYQATRARQSQLKLKDDPAMKAWRGSMQAFIGRLHWHCHFIQKLEAEPELEHSPMARSYRNLRRDFDQRWLYAYECGRTGFPFVDACMRYLRASGWINFRMRAMLMSFACYNLWLPWQKAGEVLARLFVDYEPGIHWPQSQMQAGETGINALRIYSPVKQGRDQDPDATFIARWVPELADLPAEHRHEPWLHGDAEGYPDRLVDHIATAKEARARIWEIKRTASAKAEADQVYEKHGSRRSPRSRRKAKAAS